MPDEQVEAVYAMAENEIAEGRRKRFKCVCAGDFNAEVGPRAEGDDSKVVGCNPMPLRSERGDALVKFCTHHGLVLTNTFGCN